MKKLNLICILLIVLFVTGCSSKKELICNQTISNVSVDMILGYDGEEGKEKLVSISFREDVDFSSYSDSEFDQIKYVDYCPYAKQAVGELSDAFSNCKQSFSGKILTITGDFEVSKIPNSEEGMKKSMSEAKTSLETQGFKCK